MNRPIVYSALPAIVAGILALGLAQPTVRDRSAAARQTDDSARLLELRQELVDHLNAMEVTSRQYQAAREREKAALADLELAKAESAAAASAEQPDERAASALERAEEELKAASRESAALGIEMLADLDRFDAIVEKIRKEGIELVEAAEGVTGTWRVDVGGSSAFGILSLEQQRNLVSGSIRLSTGARGTVTGRVTGGTLELEFVHAEAGIVGDLSSDVDLEASEMEGWWNRRELASGLPASGEWTARRVTFESLLN